MSLCALRKKILHLLVVAVRGFRTGNKRPDAESKELE